MRITNAHRDIAIAVVAVLALTAFALRRGQSEPPKQSAATAKGVVNLAYFPNITHAVALIGVGRGTFQKALAGYDLQTKVVNAGPDAMQALLAGAVDFAYVGPSPAITTYLKSNGTALRILAGACSGGASLIERGDESISSIKDLGGKRVAVPQLGGTQDVSLRHFMAGAGLASQEHGGTVEIVPIKNPDILALFKRKQLDAAWVPEPWASRLKEETGAKTVIDERDLWPNRRFTTTVLVVRKGFADKHPDVVNAFVRAHIDTIAWIQRNSKEAAEAANGALKSLTGKPLRPAVLAEAWSHVDFDADPNPSNLMAFAAAARDAGYSNSPTSSLDGIVDQTALTVARAKP